MKEPIPCVVDGCDWSLDTRTVPPGPLRVALDVDTYVSEVLVARAKQVDKALREHLESHDVLEWVTTVDRLKTDQRRAAARQVRG